MNLVNEGKAKINLELRDKVSREMPVFYNKDMKLNRDISIEVIKYFFNDKISVALPLAGSGIRGIRMLLEIPEILKLVYFNDHDEISTKQIKKNLTFNGISSGFEISNEDANEFILRNKGFDYIDVDPFGSPNFLLNSAIVRLARGGILAITATDTSALSGTYKNACLRKYWAVPLLNELKHELGLRILIRKVQLIGAQYDKALIPVMSYSKLHYMRVFFKCVKSKTEVNTLLKMHKYYLYCNECGNGFVSEFNKGTCCKDMKYVGPLYSGELWDKELISKFELDDEIIDSIKDEIDLVGFYDLHNLASIYKINLIKTDDLITLIRKKGFRASKTSFSKKGIKTDISAAELKLLLLMMDNK